MNNLLSRYGGHAILFNKGGAIKASAVDKPEDQSFENIMANHAIQMKGYSYLSSYTCMHDLMGPYQKLPERSVKIGDLNHEFLELIMQYDVEVSSSLYLGYTGYGNVFALFIKTDFGPVEFSMGKIKSSYDLVLMIRVQGIPNELIPQSMNEIMICLICLLVFEMGIAETQYSFIPSKTYLGKKIKMDELKAKFEILKTVENREQLLNAITIIQLAT
jgi:hypothetical protein